MSRENIPKKIKEALLDEYDHRCAICGGDRPHLHHVDENPSNNDIYNLLPLCPNCHLRDQHNPTRRIDLQKLKIFRIYKDPSILRPQFHPIYTRQLFLAEIEVSDDQIEFLEQQVKELIEFISSFEMGEFYSKRIHELVGPTKKPMIIRSLTGGPDPKADKRRKEINRDYRQKLFENKAAVLELLVEMLRYQSWANA